MGSSELDRIGFEIVRARLERGLHLQEARELAEKITALEASLAEERRRRVDRLRALFTDPQPADSAEEDSSW